MDAQNREEKSPPRWLPGYFLISEADLRDPNFQRTVVFMINHDEEGAFGLVVNRQLDVSLGQVVPEFENSPAGSPLIYQGGPVQPQYLFAIHSGFPGGLKSDQASSPIEHVVFEPAFPYLEKYLKDEWSALPAHTRPLINLYAGYAGWGSGQLENELELGAWIVRPAAVKHIFSNTPGDGWREALGELGGIHKVIAETGFKPSMN